MNFQLNFSKKEEDPLLNRRWVYLLAFNRLVGKNFNH